MNVQPQIMVCNARFNMTDEGQSARGHIIHFELLNEIMSLLHYDGPLKTQSPVMTNKEKDI